MSYEAYEATLKCTPRLRAGELSGLRAETIKAVLLNFAWRADSELVAFPSAEGQARDLCMGLRTIKRVRQWAAANGYLEPAGWIFWNGRRLKRYRLTYLLQHGALVRPAQSATVAPSPSRPQSATVARSLAESAKVARSRLMSATLALSPKGHGGTLENETGSKVPGATVESARPAIESASLAPKLTLELIENHEAPNRTSRTEHRKRVLDHQNAQATAPTTNTRPKRPPVALHAMDGTTFRTAAHRH